jgi:hypothetical protein
MCPGQSVCVQWVVLYLGVVVGGVSGRRHEFMLSECFHAVVQ